MSGAVSEDIAKLVGRGIYVRRNYASKLFISRRDLILPVKVCSPIILSAEVVSPSEVVFSASFLVRASLVITSGKPRYPLGPCG